MNITHPELVAALVKPGSDIAANITPEEADLWHGATGVASETGEILEAIVLPNLCNYGPDRENMIEELGDMEFYLQQVRVNLGITREDTLNFIGFEGCRTLPAEAALLAIAGAALLDAAKRVSIYKKAPDLSAFRSALERIESAMENIRNLLVIPRDLTISENIAKLSVRYAGLTYTDADAVARADKS